MKFISVLFAAFLSHACSPQVTAEDATQTSSERSLFEDGQVGTVDLPVSCNAEAARRLEHGLALLHHMMYTEADQTFQAVIKADPQCAMG